MENINYGMQNAFKKENKCRNQLVKVFLCIEMYNKTNIEFGFLDMRNYQGLDK